MVGLGEKEEKNKTTSTTSIKTEQNTVMNLLGQKSGPAVGSRFANRCLFYLLVFNVHFVIFLCKCSIEGVSLSVRIFAETIFKNMLQNICR